jgi:uncharacterized membrane protein
MKKGFIISLLIAVVTGIIAAIVIKNADGEIPIHWNIRGEVDGYGSPLMLLIFPITSLLTTLLLYFLPKIDPRSDNIKKSGPLLPIIMVLIAALMLGITATIAMAVNGSSISHLMTFVLLALGAIFIAIGYYIPRVKHNYMMGIRTPWTLYSEKVWVKTHKASRNWFISVGALFLVGAFLTITSPYHTFNILAPTIYAVIVMIGLVVYSYVLFAEEKKRKRK